MQIFKKWNQKRRRISTIRKIRNIAAELGISTWGWSDEEVVKSSKISCAILTQQTLKISAAMNSVIVNMRNSSPSIYKMKKAFEIAFSNEVK